MKTIFKPISKERFEEIFIKKIQKQGCEENSDGTWSCNKNVYSNHMDLTYLPVKFKEIRGDFDCIHNKFTSFNNFPDTIRENLYIISNNIPKNLEYPGRVFGDIIR